MTLILGKSIATAEQMANYLLRINPKPLFSRNISALEFCQLFIDICAKEGVRGDIAFAQSCKETGNFKFKGDVKYTQNNFSGLGATGGGNPGCVFETIEIGILAQAQHLKTYATKNPLNVRCVDPRRTAWFVNKKGGTSPNVETLGGTWAVPGYSTKKYKSLEEANAAHDSYGYQIMTIVNNILKVNVSDKKEEVNKMSYLIAIDAGHGSNTAGKRTPDGYREHWINVKCANYFDIAMKRCGFNTFKVAWDDANATDDTDISLTSRQKMIKNAKCDISVSWHANAHGNGKEYTSGQGIETLIHNYSNRVGDSKTLANKIQSYLIKGTPQKNRGVKAATLAMCNCAAMATKASVLIEIGFMTNLYEQELLKNDAFCLECAEEAAQGVCAYFGVKYVAPNSTSINPSTSTTVKTYTVASGDTLSKIGKKLGVDWKTIAELNDIKAPYRLKVGQVLKISESVTEAAPIIAVPFKVTQSKKGVQKFLNEYYGDYIKKILGDTLVVDGAIGNKSKLALGIAFQVELNKLGANLDIDGKIGSGSAKAFNKLVGSLKYGMKENIFITLWQCVLVAYNFNPLGIDGNFGLGCKSATNKLFTKIGVGKDSTVEGSDINAVL